MLKKLLSSRGRYRLYAICLAIGLFGYLLGGFMLLKALAGVEPFIPSLQQIAGGILLTGAFAIIHINSMRWLDTPKRLLNDN